MKLNHVILSCVIFTFALSSCRVKSEQYGRKNKNNQASEDSLKPVEDDDSAESADVFKPITTEDNAPGFHDDPDVANQAIVSQFDEALALTSDNVPSMDGLGLADNANNRVDRVNQSKCVEDNGIATVSILRSWSKNFALKLFGYGIESKLSSSEDKTHVWSKVDGNVECKNDKHADVGIPRKGLKVEISFARQLKADAEITIKDKVSKGRNFSFDASGKRKNEWYDEKSNADGTILIKKRGSLQASKTVQYDNAKSDDVKVFKIETTSADNAPIEVEILREVKQDGSLGKWLKKTIVSGKLISTRQNDGRIEATFDHLVFDKHAKGCLPVSGKIEGEIFVKGETEPKKKYTIDFSSKKMPEIVFLAGSVSQLVPDFCDQNIGDEE